MDSTSSSKKPIIIIGAGPAGLEAASVCNKNKIPYIVFEARDKIGGRVEDLEGWADYPIDLGAEYIHGSSSPNYELAKKHKVKFCNEDDQEDYIYYKNKVLSYYNAKKYYPEVKKIFDLSDECEEISPSDEKLSLQEFLEKNKADPSLAFVLKGMICSNQGNANMSKISVAQYAKDEELYEFGSINHMMKSHTQAQLIRAEYSCLFQGGNSDRLKLNTPIIAIENLKDSVKVITEKGDIYEGAGVIVAVPITILQKNMIEFRPELPKEIQESINRIPMGGGLKIFLKFKYVKGLFPKNTDLLYANGVFPILQHDSLGGRGQKKNIVWQSLLTGDDATDLKDKKDEELAVMILDKLKNFASSEQAMMNAYEGVIVKHWTNEKYIQGAYSYPGFGIDDSRKILSQHQGRAVFAGEHCNQNNHSTIGGAMQSGNRASSYLIKSYY